MKKTYLTLIPILVLILALITNIASAQVTGPSDATSAPPTSAADVAKILCYGSTISLSGPQDAGGVDFPKYHWYKIDASGTKQEITASTGRTYTETSGAPGYYNYQVMTENANGCTSPLSDIFKIYVLPQLSVSITTPNTSMCAISSSETLLTANVTPASGYVINYQWTKNGTVIPGATSSTYDVTGETVASTITYGVNVTYALNATCPASATKDIIFTPIPTKPMITAN